MGQADAAHAHPRPWSPLHSLEADSVLYGGLPDGEDVGEEIFGTIGMRPNAKNNVRLWGQLGGGLGHLCLFWGPGTSCPKPAS